MTVLLTASIFGCESVNGGNARAEQLTLDLRAAIIAAETVTLRATVTADYGDRAYTFGLLFSGTENDGTLEVQSPESIAGVTCAVRDGGATLKFDGAELDTGRIADDAVSPVSALPTLLAQWRSGFIDSMTIEKIGDADALLIASRITDTVSQKTWFDAKTFAPIRSEISEGGRLVIKCDFLALSK
ncbi:MAG: hypothetical protein LBN30_06585 [Oscillospiraceae bacterium]|jgi:hypothetical protein|nr:hypothetical protein [Oscillospiraceae bacterium]